MPEAKLHPRGILGILGYEVDNKGNVNEGLNQLAVITLESTEQGGVLRIHGNCEEFFYNGDELMNELDLATPVKITSRYVYFQGEDEDYRIPMREFTENAVRAFGIYNRLTKRDLAG